MSDSRATRHAGSCRWVRFPTGTRCPLPLRRRNLTRTQGSQGTSGPAPPGPPTWHPPARRLRPRAIPAAPSKPSSERSSKPAAARSTQPPPAASAAEPPEPQTNSCSAATTWPQHDSRRRCRAWGSDEELNPYRSADPEPDDEGAHDALDGGPLGEHAIEACVPR